MKPAVLLISFCLALVYALDAADRETKELTFGEVRVAPGDRTVSFPAQVNQRTGAVEYLVVHDSGKVHESIFRTKVGAQQIHAAALLFSGKETNRSAGLKLNNIEVSWTDSEKRKNFAAAELIFDKEKRRPLSATRWGYRGSRLVDGVFLAQRDGSLIAIMEDQDALIDQATPQAANDENWEPVTNKLPPVGGPVTITLRFEPEKRE